MMQLCIGLNHIFTTIKTSGGEQPTACPAHKIDDQLDQHWQGEPHHQHPVFLILTSSFLLLVLIFSSPGECVQLLPWRGRLGALVRRAHQLPGGLCHRADAFIVVVVVADEHTNYQVVFATHLMLSLLLLLLLLPRSTPTTRWSLPQS